MKIDNDTEDDIDYNQTGGGTGGDVPDPARVPDFVDLPPHVGQPQGRIPPGQSVQFAPRGRKPWTVTVTAAATGFSCEVPGLTNAGVTLTVRSLSPCDIGQS